MEKIKKYSSDIVCLITLCFMGYKYIHNIEKTLLDIMSGDEFMYIYSGLNLLQNGLPNIELSPFYSIYYYLLSMIEKNFLHLYQLNYKITFISLPIFLYLLLRRYQVSILISLLIASFIFLTNMNAMHTRVVHFALVFIFLFLYLSSFIKNPVRYFFFLSFGALFVSYCRPEFFVSFVLLFGIAIFYLLKEYKNKNIISSSLKNFRVLYNLIFVFLPALLIYTMNGIPIGKGRSFFALKQHIGRNYYIWNDERNSPESWEAFRSTEFEKINSFLDLLLLEPVLFIKHIFYNIFINLPLKIASVITLSDNLFLPQGFYYLEYMVQLIFLCIVIIFLIIFIYKAGLFKSSFVKSQIGKKNKIFLSLLSFTIPSLISIILIFPNEWYLMTPIYIFLISVSIIFLRELKFSISKKNFFLICLVLIMITPSQKIKKQRLYQMKPSERIK